MRRIILNVAVSIDGFIEGPAGEIDWCFIDQDYGMSAFFERIDTVLYGRKSYELMLAMGEKPNPAHKHYVFSQTLKTVSEGFTLKNGAAVDEVTQIKKTAGRDIWLFGGARFAGAMIQAGLVDSLLLSVHPVVLGAGKPLFEGVEQRSEFVLKDVKSYDTGLVQLFYDLKPVS
ncbi:MAG: dihydrofolate reductase [Saprospiraceae bacterium]|nr:dihydrofolate reductase [Saprospiraceae bacterium]